MPETAKLSEHAEVAARLPALALVVLPDPEVRVPLEQPLLGRTSVNRLVEAALAAGFEEAFVAPGTRALPDRGSERASGEPVETAAVVVYESAFLDPRLLELMVQHPLDRDERFSIYDEAGRPTAWFAGYLATIPSHLPVSEELELPADLGPDRIARYVYPEDRARLESLVLACEGVTLVDGAPWYLALATRTLRGLTDSRRPVEQLELLGLLGALAAGALAVIPLHVALLGSMMCLLAAVHISGLLPFVRLLRRGREAADGLAAATRPLAHGATIAGLTYRLIDETDRSSVAGLVVLGLGAGSVVLALGQARHLLQRRAGDGFPLPPSEGLAQRLGVVLPAWCVGVPLLEASCVVLALTSIPELPWTLLVAGGLARLWRWFAQVPS